KSISKPTGLLNTLDTSADHYQGPITLEGPIEAFNPTMPSLTLYGQIVLLDKVIGWEKLRKGQWISVDGDVQDYYIQARRFRFKGLNPDIDKTPTLNVSNFNAGASGKQGNGSSSSQPGGNGSNGTVSVTPPDNSGKLQISGQ